MFLSWTLFHSWTLRCASGALLALAATVSFAADADNAVDLFDAMSSGDVEVKLLVKDATQATVVMTNKTKQVLTVKMPDAFAGVLAQQPGFGFQNGGLNGGLNGGQNGGANQSVGGGFPNQGRQNGGNNFNNNGGPFFHIGPEKAKKVKVAVMCLEHGKPNPNSNVKYELVPIESYTSSPEVREVCRMLGNRETDQVSAQAAAWHFANDMTWEQLSQKIGIKHWNGRTERFFTQDQIDQAHTIVAVAKRRAAQASSLSTEQVPSTRYSVRAKF